MTTPAVTTPAVTGRASRPGPAADGRPAGEQSPAFTTRGRAVIGAGILLAGAAYLFGIREMYGLAATAGLLALSARILVGLRRVELHITRVVHPARVTAGQEARVELAIRNQGRSASPPVEARDPFDGGKRWARFSIASLVPGELRRGSYRLPSSQRGVYHLGPLELWSSDPFGLASRSRTTAADTTLTVHPRWERVAVRAASSHRDDDHRMARAVMGHGGSEFYALREYIPGDDLRHVHWPSTARLDDLVIRQPENVRRGRMTVAADLRAEVHDDSSLEPVISAVASVAMSALQQGLQVRVISTAGWDSGHGDGRLHGVAILDGLAGGEAHRSRADVSPFRLAGPSDPVVVVTTDRATAADVEAAVKLGGPHGTTVVAFATGAGGPGLPVNSRTIPVPKDIPFAVAWQRRDPATC